MAVAAPGTTALTALAKLMARAFRVPTTWGSGAASLIASWTPVKAMETPGPTTMITKPKIQNVTIAAWCIGIIDEELNVSERSWELMSWVRESTTDERTQEDSHVSSESKPAEGLGLCANQGDDKHRLATNTICKLTPAKKNQHLGSREERLNEATVEANVGLGQMTVLLNHLRDEREYGEERNRLHNPRVAEQQDLKLWHWLGCCLWVRSRHYCLRSAITGGPDCSIVSGHGHGPGTGF
ncbi:hypothetical protein HG530_003750 [Fusarium avenaceum]|nr:hypothetical protein HG530_003750 [Fusarium avenaceum]